MTAAGYRVTRWADDFVVVCRTRQEAQTALAPAETFLASGFAGIDPELLAGCTISKS